LENRLEFYSNFFKKKLKKSVRHKLAQMFNKLLLLFVQAKKVSSKDALLLKMQKHGLILKASILIQQTLLNGINASVEDSFMK
jgi:hypothetical protein